MERLRVRWLGWLDGLRASLWFLPTIAILTLLVVARLLVALEPLPSWLPEELVFGGSPDAARSVLGELIGGTITVVALSFSLTVISLQMASSQFSPRLLRSFLKDPGVQLVLSGMLASTVYDVAVLRTVRSAGESGEAFVPRLAVSVSLLLSLATVALLVYFLHHVTRMLRVDAIMDEIAAETLAQIQDLPPRREVSPDQAGVDPPAGSRVVTARSEGYLQRVDVDALARGARPQAVVVRLRPVIGEWVARGTTLAWAWGEDDPAAVDLQAVGDVVHASLHLGPDRTESADLAFGLRQLQDIAARALSPGINDPTTAVQAIGQMSSVVASLSRHPLGADIGVDDQDTVRTVAPRPTFAAHLELAVGQSRRYGRREPDVLIALLSLLTDAGELVADAADRAEAVRGQIARVEAAADLDDPGDLERVGAAAEVARRTLEAGVRPASTSDAG